MDASRQGERVRIREFNLAYGRGKIRFSLPEENVLGVLEAKDLVALREPEEVIQESLLKPIDSLPFKDKFKAKERVGILVSDHTRQTASDLFLPVLLRELNSVGIPDANIFIVFANGTHKLNTPKEQESIVGRSVAQRIRLKEHNCDDEKSLSFVGETSFKTKVYLNSEVVNADKIILTGGIIYHYFAGFGGGRKAVFPGVASREAIIANHSLVLHPQAGQGMNPYAAAGVLKNNPVHQDMQEASRFVKPHFLLNVVLNDEKKLAAVFAGDYISAYEDGCQFVRKHYGVKIRQKADLVVASCGGYPKDINFYQSHKAMDNVISALRKGGVMILLAECSQGMGGEEFSLFFEYKKKEEIEKSLRERYSIVGHIAYSTLNKAENAKVILISSLSDQQVRKMSLIPAPTLGSALNLAYERLGKNPSTYIIPQGYITVPVTSH